MNTNERGDKPKVPQAGLKPRSPEVEMLRFEVRVAETRGEGKGFLSSMLRKTYYVPTDVETYRRRC